MTYDGVCWELGTSARPIDETECGYWPTPGSQESQPTQEFIDEVKENQKGTHERLYLPGRKHHTQRTLSRAVQTWPTPDTQNHRDGKHTRKDMHGRASIRHNASLHHAVELDKQGLWPTPTASVGSGSRNTPGSKAHPGISLDDAVRGDGGTGRMWPTPKGSPSGPDFARPGREQSGGDDLLTAVTREQFPTPTSQDHKGRGEGSYDRHKGLDNHVKKWPTPGAADAKWRDTPHTAQLRKEQGSQLGLHAAVILEDQEQWPTPRAAEWKGTGPLGSKSHNYRVEKGYLDATVQERGQITGPLNPTWVEWLMGWPLGWTDLKPLETDRFRWWQHRHGLS